MSESNTPSVLPSSCPGLARGLGLEGSCCPSCLMELNDWDEYGYEPPHWIEVDGREFYPCCTHNRTAEAALNALNAKATA